MSDLSGLKDYLPAGVVTLLVAVIGYLFSKRASSSVEHANKRATRESTYEERRDQQLELALGKISELRGVIEDLRAQLEEAKRRLTVVQMVSDGDPDHAVQISRDSAFVDLTRPLKPRREPARPSPSDPFQAADPYGPKPKKK